MPKTDTMMVKKKLKKFNTKNIYNDGKKKKSEEGNWTKATKGGKGSHTA